MTEREPIPAAHAEPLLSVRNLKTHFHTSRGVVKAVNGVGFTLARGEILGIVGESGSGKSVMAQSLVRALPGLNGQIVDGEIRFDGIDLMQLDKEAMRKIRGARISMITQNPNTSLNPVFTVGAQLKETVDFHRERPLRGAATVHQRMLDLLGEVQLPSPDTQARRYPFQLSGGMKQRIAIAMALMCEPDLLIADEPTTALDVTLQAQILGLLRDVREAHGTAMLFITHDLGVVAQLCDTVAVMYAGRMVEYNSIQDLFDNPRHPYTAGLLASNPVFGKKRETLHAMTGQPPDLLALPPGCSFAARCPYATQQCRDVQPPSRAIDGKHFFACWLEEGVGARAPRTEGAVHAG